MNTIFCVSICFCANAFLLIASLLLHLISACAQPHGIVPISKVCSAILFSRDSLNPRSLVLLNTDIALLVSARLLPGCALLAFAARRPGFASGGVALCFFCALLLLSCIKMFISLDSIISLSLSLSVSFFSLFLSSLSLLLSLLHLSSLISHLSLDTHPSPFSLLSLLSLLSFFFIYLLSSLSTSISLPSPRHCTARCSPPRLPDPPAKRLRPTATHQVSPCRRKRPPPQPPPPHTAAAAAGTTAAHLHHCHHHRRHISPLFTLYHLSL